MLLAKLLRFLLLFVMVCCAAFGCFNRSGRKSICQREKSKVSFHLFPKNEERRTVWLRACRRKCWDPPPRSYLCSEHFAPECFKRTSPSSTCLKRDAVPTIFPALPECLQQAIMMDEDQLMDVLENRISSLESRVIGNTETVENISPACETLLQTNTLMSSVLSGREKINAVTKRLSELEKYLDPEFEDFSTADVALKTELILSMAPVLEESLKMLEQMSDLTPVLDSKEIKTVPDLSSRLEQLSLFHLEKKKSVDEISENIVYLLRQYNTVIENLTKAFVQWDNIVTQLEDSRKPKTLD